MIKQLFTETKKQPQGTYVQTALHANIINTLPEQNPFKNTGWATYKFYKTS